jgi:hypothetical protein
MTATAAAIAVIGDGVVGDRVSKMLRRVLPDATIRAVDTRVVETATAGQLDDVGIAVLAHTAPQVVEAEALLRRDISVVSVSDDLDDVRDLLELDHLALSTGASCVVGAGMSTGLSTLVSARLAEQLEVVDEVHLAVHGTAGPACARQHHRALAGNAVLVDDGDEVVVRAGSGRELCWFPEPVGAYDCYRAELPAPLVLQRSLPHARRITARISANRRDRLTSRLPMLTPPHSEGGVGAIRVEVRGSAADGARVTLIAGIAELVGTATAATAVSLVEQIAVSALPSGVVAPGDPSVDIVACLKSITRLGVRLQEFTGVPTT